MRKRLGWARRIFALPLAFALFAPPVAAAPPALSVYGQLPGFELAAMSQSGQRLAIVGLVDGVRTILIVDGSGHALRSVAVDDAKIRDIEWAGDSYLLIHYSAAVGLGPGFSVRKAELSAVMVLPLDDAKPWPVFGNISSITGGVWSSYGVRQVDGRWVGYFGGITLQRTMGGGSDNLALPAGRLIPDLYAVDLQTHAAKLIAKGGSEDVKRDWLVDANGTVGASLDVAASSGRWTIRNGNGKSIAAGIDPLGRVALVGFTPDGTAVIYGIYTNNGGTLLHWYSVPLAGGEARPYLDDKVFDDIFFDNGNRLIGYRNSDVAGQANFFDPHREKIFKATERAFPGLRMDFEAASDSFEQLIVRTQGPGDPITWWQVDIHTGNAEILGRSYVVKPEDVGPMRMVSYKAGDGLKMEGVLTLPPGRSAEHLPAVMLPHGGPTAHDTAGFDWMAQALASRGYAVFQPNFRGSDGYGAEFQTAGNGEWGRSMQSDISDGLAELVRQGIVDPQRVCIMGASYGGYAALAGVTLQQGIYRCAIAVAGVSDLPRMVRDDLEETGHDPMMERNLKLLVGSGRDLKAVSPIQFADRVAAPVLLIHGKDDTVVNFAQSKSMADALKRAGKPVEFVTLPHEDHWLSSSDTRLVMLQASIDFLLKNNPPGPAPGGAAPASSPAPR